MGVAVMHVRIVAVSVNQLFMPVCMRMRFASIPGERMRVPVVLVVNVRVHVILSHVSVYVLVMLGDVQPDADGHERSGDEQLRAHRIRLQKDRGDSSEEWSDREIGARSRAAEMAQRQDEQHEADAVTR